MVALGIDWQSASRTHVGNVRKLNEDALLDRADVGLWAVADGMGGHHAGEIASQRIVTSLNGLDHLGNAATLEDSVYSALAQVNGELRAMAIAKGTDTVIGSTVAVMIARENRAVFLWAGDSRIYRLRDGKLGQLTRDHSQVEDMVAQGMISRAEAEDHPAANVITRAVGADDQIEIDRSEATVHSGDVYLLCSDGLNKTVPEREISHISCPPAPVSSRSAPCSIWHWSVVPGTICRPSWSMRSAPARSRPAEGLKAP